MAFNTPPPNNNGFPKNIVPTVNFSEHNTEKNMDGVILDNLWGKRSFLVPSNSITNEIDNINRYATTASLKFTDTRAGGNVGINSRPQFTRYADIRVKGLLAKFRSDVSVNVNVSEYGFGMGRYYSEAIDDNSRLIFLRFGVPQFNYLSRYFGNAFNYGDAFLARTGRKPPFLYDIAKWAGYVARLWYFPVFTATMFTFDVTKKVLGLGSNKFYSVKPTMHLYWANVNSMINNIAVNLGLLSMSFGESDKPEEMYSPYVFDNDTISLFKKFNPDFFQGNSNTIDIFALIGRPQRMANVLAKQQYTDRKDGNLEVGNGLIDRYTNAATKAAQTSGNTFIEYINNTFNFTYYKSNSDDQKKLSNYLKAENNEFIDPTKLTDPKALGDTNVFNSDDVINNTQTVGADANKSFFKDFMNSFSSSLRDGYEYLTLRVEGADSVSDSFSNDAKTSDLANSLNSITKRVDDARFATAGASLIDIPVVGDALRVVKEGVSSLLAGGAESITFGFSNVIAAFLEGGYFDIPKNWSDSSYDPGTLDYKFKLISPYGNPISQLQNIYIPIACLLSAALPMAVGKASYASPFLVQLWDQGRQQVNLGLIRNLSITRGTSNLPFTNKGRPLAIDVSFSVMNLDNIVAMPVGGGLFGNAGLDEDNSYKNFLSVLTGQSLYDQVYPVARTKLNLNIIYNELNQYTSAARWGSLFGETLPGRALNAVLSGNTTLSKL